MEGSKWGEKKNQYFLMTHGGKVAKSQRGRGRLGRAGPEPTREKLPERKGRLPDKKEISEHLRMGVTYIT